jgi:hypothetical protein
MKFYVGIKRSNGYYYIATLDHQGTAVLKKQLPITAPRDAIIKSIASLKEAFQASLRIAICLENFTDSSLKETIENLFGPVKLVQPSLLYSTDFIPDDPFGHDFYRHSIHLAILKSLED